MEQNILSPILNLQFKNSDEVEGFYTKELNRIHPDYDIGVLVISFGDRYDRETKKFTLKVKHDEITFYHMDYEKRTALKILFEARYRFFAVTYHLGERSVNPWGFFEKIYDLYTNNQGKVYLYRNRCCLSLYGQPSHSSFNGLYQSEFPSKHFSFRPMKTKSLSRLERIRLLRSHFADQIKEDEEKETEGLCKEFNLIQLEKLVKQRLQLYECFDDKGVFYPKRLIQFGPDLERFFMVSSLETKREDDFSYFLILQALNEPRHTHADLDGALYNKFGQPFCDFWKQREMALSKSRHANSTINRFSHRKAQKEERKEEEVYEHELVDFRQLELTHPFRQSQQIRFGSWLKVPWTDDAMGHYIRQRPCHHAGTYRLYQGFFWIPIGTDWIKVKAHYLAGQHKKLLQESLETSYKNRFESTDPRLSHVYALILRRLSQLTNLFVSSITTGITHDWQPLRRASPPCMQTMFSKVLQDGPNKDHLRWNERMNFVYYLHKNGLQKMAMDKLVQKNLHKIYKTEKERNETKGAYERLVKNAPRIEMKAQRHPFGLLSACKCDAIISSGSCPLMVIDIEDIKMKDHHHQFRKPSEAKSRCSDRLKRAIQSNGKTLPIGVTIPKEMFHPVFYSNQLMTLAEPNAAVPK